MIASPVANLWLGRILLGLFATLFFAAGVFHFVRPGPFIRIVPPWIIPTRLAAPGTAAFARVKYLLVAVSGAAEILLAIGLVVPSTRAAAAWGIVALLVAVFPANYYMFREAADFAVPYWVLAARLPLQGALIYWATRYT